MSLRSYGHNSLQNYPRIQIDRGSVIKPCVSDQTISDPFIDRPVANWKKVLSDLWHEGIPFLIKWISNLNVPVNGNPYYTYLIKFIKYIALFLVHIHSVYLYIYGHFYPYSLMSNDEVCDIFSRCPKWSEAVIRAFAWHPNQDRCALAICNDYIYVYQGPTRIRVLRHNLQKKIIDLAWKPNSNDILVVATQTAIILWRVTEHQVALLGYKDNSRNASLTYLAPGIHLVKREREVSFANGSTTNNSTKAIQKLDNSNTFSQDECFKIVNHILNPPITSIQFDGSGDKLLVVSPNSSRIAILDINGLLNTPTATDKTKKNFIKYIRNFPRYGFTKLLYSPEKDRLAVGTTSSFLRVFEPFTWSSNKWSIHADIVQDMVWSKPSGRILLIADKSDPILYALAFLDKPQAKDVGGNKTLLKALDLTATRGEFGDTIGGRVQSFAWDKEGKRLAISFKDNPESILLYRTIEKPTVQFHQLGVLRSDNCSYPLIMEFHDKFKNGSLLTICWSDGNCQHVPLPHTPQEKARNTLSNDDSFDNSMNRSTNSFNQPTSAQKTSRSFTSLCQVSGNNSISSFPASLMPINKIQHQKTLFSLSSRSPLMENNVSNSSNE